MGRAAGCSDGRPPPAGSASKRQLTQTSGTAWHDRIECGRLGVRSGRRAAVDDDDDVVCGSQLCCARATADARRPRPAPLSFPPRTRATATPPLPPPPSLSSVANPVSALSSRSCLPLTRARGQGRPGRGPGPSRVVGPAVRRRGRGGRGARTALLSPALGGAQTLAWRPPRRESLGPGRVEQQQQALAALELTLVAAWMAARPADGWEGGGSCQGGRAGGGGASCPVLSSDARPPRLALLPVPAFVAPVTVVAAPS